MCFVLQKVAKGKNYVPASATTIHQQQSTDLRGAHCKWVGRPRQQADIKLFRDVTNGWNLIEAWAFGQEVARGSDSVILQDIVAVPLNKATFNLKK